MGKNWAKGLTSETDARIANSARAHTGLKYARRTPLADCRWWTGPRVEVGPTPWSAGFAYAAGLFATDGSISIRPNGYANMSFSSKDFELVRTFCECIGITAKIRERRRERWDRTWINYEVSFSSVRLASWYRDIGITPRKSLTLGALRVPDEYIFDTVRGLLDGDGYVARYVDSRGRRCFSIRFYSASKAHLEWLASRLRARLEVTGALNAMVRRRGLSKRPMYQLSFGREHSIRLAAELYRDAASPRLARKFDVYRTELESRARS